MDLAMPLPWTYDLEQAIHLQEHLRERLILAWQDRPVDSVAGIDVSDAGEVIYASITLFRYPDLAHLHTVTGQAAPAFPYIPGLLTFRVGPAVLTAWEKLPATPDLLLVHGHGIAHPRGMGLASHLGLWLNLPTIGVARQRLYGRESEPGPGKGDWSVLLDEHHAQHIIGAALRTRAGCNPVYVSPGHLIDLEHAITFVMATCTKYRTPEPLRSAHKKAAGLRQSARARFTDN